MSLSLSLYICIYNVYTHTCLHTFISACLRGGEGTADSDTVASNCSTGIVCLMTVRGETQTIQIEQHEIDEGFRLHGHPFRLLDKSHQGVSH